MDSEKRIAFLDYLRIAACFMVMLVHSCEPFYFDAEGNFFVASKTDAVWLTLIDSACRAAVPLFVMASSYLLFPLNRPTGGFLRRRAVRVLVPFAVWAAVYTALAHGEWGRLAFNFPDAAGHLWFVPMLCGIYLLMPPLSPWAEKVGEKELRGWLIVWFATTFFPFARRLWAFLYGDPSFGAVPYLWGECPWNPFGAFHYVSGFVGYLLLGLYFRKFPPAWSVRRTLGVAASLWIAGMAVVAGGFFLRIPAAGGFPVKGPYALAVDLEMSWEFCSAGVALTTAAYFFVLRLAMSSGLFYRLIVRPASEASYGAYLVHMIVLPPVMALLRPHLATPLTIVGTAALTFVAATAASALLRRIPAIGRLVAG